MHLHQAKATEQGLCPYELSSIRSMTSYVAQRQNIQEKIIESILAAKFDVGAVAQLRHEHFRQAIVFLIDLNLGPIETVGKEESCKIVL